MNRCFPAAEACLKATSLGGGAASVFAGAGSSPAKAARPTVADKTTTASLRIDMVFMTLSF
jgi:hypothetical protein